MQIPAYCNFSQATDARFFCENGAGVSGNQNYCTYLSHHVMVRRDGASILRITRRRSRPNRTRMLLNNANESDCETSGGVNARSIPADSTAVETKSVGVLNQCLKTSTGSHERDGWNNGGAALLASNVRSEGRPNSSTLCSCPLVERYR